MAGFMSGFGPAFARSFEAGNERIHEKRQDAFRVAYDDWVRKRNQYDEDERSWKKNLEAGNLLAERYGAPPEAGLKAAEWLAAGYSMDDVDEMMRTTDFTVLPEIETETPQQPNDVDTQMQQSGMVPEINDPTKQPVQQEEDTGLISGVFGPGGIFQNAGKSDAERAQQELQAQLGLTPEEFDRINSGFQRPQSPNIQMTMREAGLSPLEEFGLAEGITDSKLYAAQVNADQWAKSGDPVLEAKAARFEALLPDIMAAMQEDVSPETRAKIAELLKPTQTVRMEIGEKKASIKTAIENGKILADMVEDSDGMVLTTVAGGVSFLETLKTEADAFFDVLGQMTGNDPNAPVDESTLMAALDQVIGSGSVPDEISQQYREFNAAAITYAYAMAQAIGAGSGRELSNQDFERVYKSIFTSNDKDAFLSSLKRSLMQQINAVNNTSESVFNSPDIQMLIDPNTEEPYMAELGNLLTETLGPLETWIQPEHMEWLQAPAPTRQAPSTGQPDTTQPSTKGFTVGERRRTRDGRVMIYVGGDPYDPSNWREENSSGR